MGEISADIVRATQPYRALIREFASGVSSADGFEAAFLSRYLADETLWPPELFDILDELFVYVDDYVSDPELRDRAGGVDATTLKLRATEALAKLERFT